MPKVVAHVLKLHVEQGLVSVDGVISKTAAVNVSPTTTITINGKQVRSSLLKRARVIHQLVV